MPIAVVSGILLLRRAPLGYLLASIVLVKSVTLGTAVSAMVVGQLLALLGIGQTVVLLCHVSQGTSALAAHA